MNWALVMPAAVAVAGGLGALLWLALGGGGAQAKAIRSNLSRGLGDASPRATVRPDRRGGVSRLLAGPAMVGHLERLIIGAGRPAKWPVDRVVSAKILAALAGFGIGALLWSRLGTAQALLLMIALSVGAFFVPDLLLWNSAIKRRQAIQLELPDTLDQMSIAVDAGLGFDSAMLRVARNGKGVLAEELIRTLQDLQVGQSRRQAYTGLADRCGVPDLRRFMRSVIQAEEYGIALADVLNTQAQEMRIGRRQRAERKAMEIPVKITFPLILFILPVLMIVILGPAILSAMEVFG